MSRLWDTPDFWARREADEMMRELWDIGPAALADSLEARPASYDSEPEMVAAILSDLRARAAAGVRFWPDTVPADLRNDQSGVPTPMPDDPVVPAGPIVRADADADLIDDEIPW